jgi:hypothetical protein
MSDNFSRRSFVLSSLALPAGIAALAGGATAEELRQLTAADPRVPALGYVADAAQAKADKMFKPGSNCANCSQLKGKPGDKLRPCALFPDLQNPKQLLLVSAGGWCRSWTALPKPA